MLQRVHLETHSVGLHLCVAGFVAVCVALCVVECVTECVAVCVVVCVLQCAEVCCSILGMLHRKPENRFSWIAVVCCRVCCRMCCRMSY